MPIILPRMLSWPSLPRPNIAASSGGTGFVGLPQFVLLKDSGTTVRARIISAGILSFLLFLSGIVDSSSENLAAGLDKKSFDCVQIIPTSISEPAVRHAAQQLARKAALRPESLALLARFNHAQTLATAPPGQTAFGPIRLQAILHNETELANAFSSLPVEERVVFPKVFIHVDAVWFKAIPEVGERLYFSTKTPTTDDSVLTFDASSGRLTVWQINTPLWRIENAGAVSELGSLTSVAAVQIGAPPELVQVFAWHPNEFEKAIRQVILQRLRQLRIQPSSVDTVTIRFRWTGGEFTLDLEPVYNVSVRS